MSFAFWPVEEKIMFFGSFDDCRDRAFLLVLLPKELPDIAVVVKANRNIRIFNKSLLPPQLTNETPFDLWADLVGIRFSLVNDGELEGITAVLFKQAEETASLNLQNIQDITKLDFFVDVALKQSFELLITKRLVELFGHDSKLLFTMKVLTTVTTFSPLIFFK
jgi:hypothetical protein